MPKGILAHIGVQSILADGITTESIVLFAITLSDHGRKGS